MSAQTTIARAEVAPADEKQVLQTILKEVRQLRLAVDKAQANTSRLQIAVERLRRQQEQVDRLTTQLQETQNEAQMFKSSKSQNAVNWITQRQNGKPAVVNMSLTSGTLYQTIENAIKRSISTGITYVIAAGNDGIDANYVSPARVPEAITVGATDRYDNRAYFGYDKKKRRYSSSNYGTAVDLFAPGKEIVSACISCSTGYIYNGGTSMAAPHVAGAAAIYLQYYPNASPAQVHNAIVSTATPGVLGYIGAGSPNRLLDSWMQY